MKPNATPRIRPRLALYGGAFDPPTLGHTAFITRLLQAGFDRVLVMPCFRHTFGKSLAPAADRLVLASAAFAELALVRVSSFEIDLGLNGSTFELVTKLPLLPEYRTHEVFLAIGSDEANLIHRWRRHRELLALIPFVVVERPGHPLTADGNWATHPPHWIVAGGQPLVDVSSSRVRSLLVSGQPETARPFLHPRIFRHVCQRQLYRTPAAA